MSATRTDAQLAAFAAEYPAKLYYFCLRKTGDSAEAEELAADIALCVVDALRRGAEITHFPAWVWQIAHNRFAAWADARRRSRSCTAIEDIADLPLADPDGDVEAALIHDETLSLMRRELAFTARDCREIIVAHYLDDERLSDIAARLGLPLGTVKAKLSRSRQKLKEGMQMAREFGKRSYRPEEITFTKNGNDGRDGSPWTQLGSRLNKNILLEAYGNPCTIADLSMELGVAAPYMEDAVEELCAVELLRREGERYVTGFPILSRRAQEKIFGAMKQTADEIYPHAQAALAAIRTERDRTGVVPLGGYQDFPDLGWYLLLRITDEAIWNAKVAVFGERKPLPERPRGGRWTLVGYEDYNPGFSGVGLHGSGDDNTLQWEDYKIGIGGLSARCGGDLVGAEAATLEKFLRGSGAVDLDILARLAERGYLRSVEGGYLPTFPVFRQGSSAVQQACSREVYDAEVLPHVLAIEIAVHRFMQDNEAVVAADLPDGYTSDFATIMYPFELRDMMLKKALAAGVIAMPDDAAHTTIALGCGI